MLHHRNQQLQREYRRERALAKYVRLAADSIRQNIKNTVLTVIAVGRELQSVKKAIRGQFGLWLRVEFGWTKRKAQQFMAVAKCFGPKSAIIAHLQIVPTAAYYLVAPSVPEEAREEAISRAEAGEKITVAIAKSIVARCREEEERKPVPPRKLFQQLTKILQQIQKQFGQPERRELKRILQELVEVEDAQESVPANLN
jgi:hypothetical protein